MKEEAVGPEESVELDRLSASQRVKESSCGTFFKLGNNEVSVKKCRVKDTRMVT